MSKSQLPTPYKGIEIGGTRTFIIQFNESRLTTINHMSKDDVIKLVGLLNGAYLEGMIKATTNPEIMKDLKLT